MNTLIKILPVAVLLIGGASVEAKPADKQSKTVDTKCFVELVGGGEMVTFWNIPNKKLPGLSKSIIGRKVMMTGTKQKVEIYKAHECALLNDDFSNSRAKIIDVETAR